MAHHMKHTVVFWEWGKMVMCYTVSLHNIAYRTGVHDCIVVKCYHGYHGKHRCTLVIPSYSGVYHFTPNPKKTMIFFIWCAMLFLTWDALTIMN